MAKKSYQAHTVIRNKKLFCLNCGGSFAIPFPIGISEMSDQMKSFERLHTSCKPVWKQPEPDMTQSIWERAAWWLINGEHGTSSQTIWCVLTIGQTDFKFDYEYLKEVLVSPKQYTHPCDPGDFYRCYMLLKAVPEWKNELCKLIPISPVWEKLVENWDKLTLLLEHQIAGETNDMYEVMKKLGC